MGIFISKMVMTVFLKYQNQWSCYKGNKAIDKAKSHAYKLLSMGIPSTLYKKGWILIAKYN